LIPRRRRLLPPELNRDEPWRLVERGSDPCRSSRSTRLGVRLRFRDRRTVVTLMPGEFVIEQLDGDALEVTVRGVVVSLSAGRRVLVESTLRRLEREASVRGPEVLA